ncbi:MAG: tetratricopeptide repeat protein [Pseudomonadota bacterium]
MVEKKISRKELLKTPDEFLTFSEKAYEFVRVNSKQFTMGVIIAATLILLGIGITSYNKYSARQAMTSYNQAIAAVSSNPSPDEQTVRQTVEKLDKFISDHSGSNAARHALIDLGALYFKLKDYEKAEKALLAFVEKAGGNEERHIRAAALSTLANIYETQGDYKKAAARWEEIINIPGQMLKEEAYRALGRDYQAMGETDKARKSYSTFLEKFPTSPDSPLVEARLEDLSE